MKKVVLIVFALMAVLQMFAQDTAEQKDTRRRAFIDDFLATYEAAYEKKEIEYIKNFFSDDALIITETKIIWKCLFLKKQVMEISQIKFVCKRRFTRGNVVANKQRYNNSYAYILITTQNSLPDLNIEKIRTKDGLIKFTMSDKLVKCLRERVPRHACRL